MKRFLLIAAIPALALVGCSSEHPQQALRISGSASASGADSAKVVNSATPPATKPANAQNAAQTQAKDAKSDADKP
jgi:hypothetical protein